MSDRSAGAAVTAGGTVLVIERLLAQLRAARCATEAATDALDERSRMLELSELRHRSLIEQLPGVIVVYALGSESHPAQPLYVSPQSQAMLGIAPDEWMMGFDEVLARVHPEDRVTLEQGFVEMAMGGAPRPVEFRFTRPDGEEIWLRDAAGVIDDIDGVRVLQALLFDITDAKAAEARGEQMELELRLGQKLEAVGELAAGIAHEINTPIQYVSDTLRFLNDAHADVMALVAAQQDVSRAAEAGTVSPELLERACVAEQHADLDYLAERVPAAFARANDGVDRVATIVRAMREFSHAPSVGRAPVDLNEALRNTLIVAASTYSHVADVETTLDDLPAVHCNAGDINQVLLNLIVNAAHAIGDAVADTTERGTLRIRTCQAGDDVVVSIGDSGGGIPAEIAERVFDPFFTTKEVGSGSGQGLAIARTLVVERHGGTLSFESEPGVGTTFHMQLPINAHEPADSVDVAA